MGLYSPSAELVSPLARGLAGCSVVRGTEQLRAYFARGLARYPELCFELVDTFRGESSVTLLFWGAGRRLVAEVLFLDQRGRIERVHAHYQCVPAADADSGEPAYGASS